MDSRELSGWLAYLKVHDDFTDYHMAKAMSRVFAAPPKGKPGFSGVAEEAWDEEDEEIIDTTDPAFAEQFQGFITR